MAYALPAKKHLLRKKMHIPEQLEHIWKNGQLTSRLIQGREKKGAAFEPYFNYLQPLQQISPHHALMLLRGRRENILRLSFKFPLENPSATELTKQEKNQIDKELFLLLRNIAEKKAVSLCVNNIHEKLSNSLSSYPKESNFRQIIMGLDTQLRAIVKVAIIDETGKFLDATCISLYPLIKDWYGSIAELAKLIIKYEIKFISIGSGPAFREISHLIHDLINMYPDLNIQKQNMQITGVPAYNPVELIDESFWEATSIARRLQDPFTELVKIDVSTMNAGPYQQDVRPEILKPALESAIQEYIHHKPVPNSSFKKSTNSSQRPHHKANSSKHSAKPLFNSAMADALSKLKLREKS